MNCRTSLSTRTGGHAAYPFHRFPAK